MPLSVTSVHSFVLDAFLAAIAVRSYRYRAFSTIPLNDLRLEDASGDAARMREFFLSDNRAAWQRYTPQVLWEDYEEMKEAVLY